MHRSLWRFARRKSCPSWLRVARCVGSGVSGGWACDVCACLGVGGQGVGGCERGGAVGRCGGRVRRLPPCVRRNDHSHPMRSGWVWLSFAGLSGLALVGLLESVAGVVMWESSSLRRAPSSVRFGRLFGSASAVEQNGYPMGSLSSCAHIAACVVDPAFVGWFGFAAASSGLRGAWCSFWLVCLVSSLARGWSVSS